MCCGGCGGCECGYAIANVLYVSERLASCCAAMLVVVCLVGTLITMMALGVGLGYNYCVVDHKKEMSEPLESDGGNSRRRNARRMMPNNDMPEDASIIPDNIESLPNLFRKRKHANRWSIDSNRLPAENRSKPSAETKTNTNSENTTKLPNKILKRSTRSFQDIEIKPTMIVSLRKYNLNSLIERLKKYSTNVTIELIQ